MTPFTQHFQETGEVDTDKLLLSMDRVLSVSNEHQFCKFARVGKEEIQAPKQMSVTCRLNADSLENLVRGLCDLIEETTFLAVVEHGVLAAPALPFSVRSVGLNRRLVSIPKWKLSSDSTHAEVNPDWYNARRLYLDPEKSGTSLFRVTPSIVGSDIHVLLEHQYFPPAEPAPYSLV